MTKPIDKEQAACRTWRELVNLYVARGSVLKAAEFRANKVWESRKKRGYA
jgi:hypothetical protein